MQSGRPNILLILCDQQRYDCIGYSQAFPVKTPHIDKLAHQGMWFTHAFSHLPVCGPARQSLLHGQRPESFGALWNHDITLPVQCLEPNQYVWTRDLKEFGYTNGHVGKWHVHPVYTPLNYGFDDCVSEEQYEGFRRDHYPDVHYTNGWFGEQDPIPVEDSKTHWLARQAIDLLATYVNADAPWHLRVDFSEPHLPCRPTERFAAMYSPEFVPPWGSIADSLTNKPFIQRQQRINWEVQDFSWEDWAPIVARYYGIISQMDEAIGLILDALERLGAADNTIVIFTTDHGDMCGSHGMLDKHYVLYDDLIRVPFVIRWPGKIRSASFCDNLVYNLLDIAPTIVELLGMDPVDLAGQSLLPLLFGQEDDNWRQQIVATYNGQQFGLYTQRMIRTSEWKYIWNATDVDEFYDLKNDPWEIHNLIADKDHDELIAELRCQLYHELVRNKDGIVKRPWIRNQLLPK